MSQRNFASLRARPAVPISTGEEEPIESVIRRLFVTSGDGNRVLAWMMNETEGACALGSSEALIRDAEGARRFVAKVRSMIAGTA